MGESKTESSSDSKSEEPEGTWKQFLGCLGIFIGIPALLVGMVLLLMRMTGGGEEFARMPLGKFHLYTFVGSWPWCFGLAWLGMVLGDKWDSDPRVKAAFHSADALILGVIVLLAAAFVWHRLRGHKRRA